MTSFPPALPPVKFQGIHASEELIGFKWAALYFIYKYSLTLFMQLRSKSSYI